MHQIRVHLQWLGYPIINDPIYNHSSWGPNRGCGGVSDELVHEVPFFKWYLEFLNLLHCLSKLHPKQFCLEAIVFCFCFNVVVETNSFIYETKLMQCSRCFSCVLGHL